MAFEVHSRAVPMTSVLQDVTSRKQRASRYVATIFPRWKIEMYIHAPRSAGNPRAAGTRH